MYIYIKKHAHTHIFIWYTSIHALYNVIKTIIQCRPYTDHIWHTDHIFTFRLPRRLPWRAKESDATSRRTWTTAPPVWILRMPVAWLGRVGTGWDGLGRVGTGWDAGIPRENHGKTMEKPWKSHGKATEKPVRTHDLRLDGFPWFFHIEVFAGGYFLGNIGWYWGDVVNLWKMAGWSFMLIE